MKTQLLILALSLLVTLTSFSQSDPMSRLEPMVGQWSGLVEMRGPQGQMKIAQSEDIRFDLDGKILVIKGTGRIPETDSITFQAFGVIHHQEDGYKFSAYTHEGNYVLADAQFEEDNLIWSFKVPNGGTVRYTLNITDNKWIEDGHFSQDGETWYPFIHMELEKEN